VPRWSDSSVRVAISGLHHWSWASLQDLTDPSQDFHKAHIPTERLSFEAIVRFAITELGVKPQMRDWLTTLDASEAAFKEHQTNEGL
jgi:hypothetical protein